jgi:hypothetical protein
MLPRQKRGLPWSWPHRRRVQGILDVCPGPIYNHHKIALILRLRYHPLLAYFVPLLNILLDPVDRRFALLKSYEPTTTAITSTQKIQGLV